MNRILFFLTFASALGSALMSGTFYAFSVFIMGAFKRLPVPQGIAAMQSVNVTVITPLFMTVFLGTAATSLVLLAFTFSRWSQPGAACLLAGTLLYLVGTLLVTMACNVPRNDALASLNPSTSEASLYWSQFLRSWTAWNTVRTLASLAATACFITALLKAPRLD